MHRAGGASTTLTTHLDLLCEPSTMLFFFSPSSTPSQLLLHQRKDFLPQGFCSTFAASTLHAMLLHPNTLQKPSLPSLPLYFLSRCHPVHTLASPGVGQDPLCSSLKHTPHTHESSLRTTAQPFSPCAITLLYFCLQLSKYQVPKNVTNFFPTPHPPT